MSVTVWETIHNGLSYEFMLENGIMYHVKWPDGKISKTLCTGGGNSTEIAKKASKRHLIASKIQKVFMLTINMSI
jgi:hypothetical protein